MKNLPRIFIIVAIICVVIGAFTSIMAIWGMFDHDVFWRTLSTLGVVFISSVFISTLTNTSALANSQL